MALARNKARSYSGQSTGSLPLASSTTVYEGAAIGIDSATGRARSVVAGDLFAGFACHQASSVADVSGAAPSLVGPGAPVRAGGSSLNRPAASAIK